MKDLQPFTKEPKCVKCLVGIAPLLKYSWTGDGVEYISVTCEACGYTWNMKTADNKKELLMEKE